MSTLIVEVCRVEEILPHENADRLEIVCIKGWKCIVQKDTYTVGDLVIYAPVDSMIPEELSDAMDVTKYLGKRGRVRTTKLRGEYSQGLIIPLEFVPDHELINFKVGDDYAEALGITKYEPPPRMEATGAYKWALPDNPHFHKYTNIENIKNFPNILQSDEAVVVTEKIHGTNFRVAKVEGEFLVGSHNVNIKYHEENLYWRTAVEYDLESLLLEGDILYGEIYGPGIQKNFHYNRETTGAIFYDLFRDGKYLNYPELSMVLRLWKLPQVPVLEVCGWNPDLMSHADGLSFIGNNIKEGIVIKPVVERWDHDVGRVILKHISEKYLLKDYGDAH